MASPADGGDGEILVRNIHLGSSDVHQLPADPVYVVYKRRWYILAVVSVLNVSNAMIWLSYSPIADYTATYYSIGAMSVNWLSLVYPIAAIPFGFLATWIVDTFGLRIGIIGGSWFNVIGGGLRVLSSTHLIDEEYKYYVLIGGQSLAAIAQPFFLFVPAKIAAVWFKENQRTTANMITSMSNPLGILLANVLSPIIVSGATDIPSLNEYYMIPAGVGTLLATFGICSSVPPTPPSPSAAETSKSFLQGIKSMFKIKAYWILMLCFGVGVGLFTALTTLLEQILCPRGYSDSFAGLCGALLIGVGVVGAGIAGVFVDKTKKFEEVTKFCYALAAVSAAFFAIISGYRNQEVLVGLSISLFGFFGFAIYPLCLELSVECAYPVAEATTAGFLLMSGQILSIALIVVMPLLAKNLSASEMSYQVCKTSGVEGITPKNFTVPNIVFASLAAVGALVLIIFFKSPYKRLQAEQQSAAERILNFSTRRQESSVNS